MGLSLLTIDGGAVRPLNGSEVGDLALQWSSDGHWLFARPRRGDDAAAGSSSLVDHVVRINIETGRREPWKEFRPVDTLGMSGLRINAITPDGKTLAVTYQQRNSDLFAVDGWK